MSRKQITTTLDEDILKKLKHYAVDNNTDVNRVIEEAVELWLTLKDEKSTYKDVLDNLPISGGSEAVKALRDYIHVKAI